MQSSLLSSNKVQASATGAINDLAEQKTRAGVRVYNLSVGEPVVPASEFMAEAAARAVRDGQTRYAPIAGLPALRQAAAEWLNKTYVANYASPQTLITCGGKFGIYLLCQTLLSAGDEALIISPFWVSYSTMVKMAGAEPKIITTEEKSGWKISAAGIESACNLKTKVLFLNSANNPTGAVYSRAELGAILAVAKKNNLMVISDEVYSGLTYEGEYVSCASFPEYQDNVAVVQSCSKNFAMTGWRVGFVFAPESVIKSLVPLQSQTITGTSTVSQAVALAVLGQAVGINSAVRDKMKARRDLFISEFNRLFKQAISPPVSALYAFVPLTVFAAKETNSQNFCGQVLEKFNVALVPGAAFGQEGYARLSFGSPENEIIEALSALALVQGRL